MARPRHAEAAGAGRSPASVNFCTRAGQIASPVYMCLAMLLACISSSRNWHVLQVSSGCQLLAAAKPDRRAFRAASCARSRRARMAIG